jgi:hypothetical protein
MTGLGPPTPIPDWLAPLRSPLGPGDLRAVPSTAELRVLVRLLDHEGLAGWTMITQRDGSPWLEFDVAVPVHAEARDGVRAEVEELKPGGVVHKFALWRYTGKVYRVGTDGAVEDDPIDIGEDDVTESR